ncbi:hypothetical protein [Pontibacter burrus]|uniref:Uncharacterized protein n=1 Tax=Pontibacter burrus TaxID=2704466 RepID=A0A6B3LHF8_9BACT|nr:hypothetical protein [Pontibacter burrus]NEM96442.1 hypothetical protein [Pontibacter burrus]
MLAFSCSLVLANNNANNGATATQTQNQQTTVPTATVSSTDPAKAKVKATGVRSRDKSVLDAERLDSPLSYFKEAFTPEDERSSSDMMPAMVSTVKALIATLLSTVM